MSGSRHVWRCLGVLCLLAMAPRASAEDVFERERLGHYEAMTPDQLFADPRLACYLAQVLSPQELSALKDRMQSLELGDGQPDATGAYTFEGMVPGLGTLMEAVVAVHPDGRVWVAYLDDGQVKYFTQDVATQEKPPPPVAAWVARFEDTKLVAVSAKRPKKPEEVAARCSREKHPEPRAQECTDATPFSPQRAAAVKEGVPGGRAYFFSEPVPCPPGPGACKFRKKAYLVPQDAVELTSSEVKRNDFVCVAYRTPKGQKVVGWMSESALGTELLKLPTGRSPLGQQAAPWVGTWSQPNASVQLQAEGPQRLEATGQASFGANTGDFTASYTVAGPVARLEPPLQGADCQVRLRLFNNALYVEDNGNCGGVGVSFRGLFYREPR